MTPEQFTELIDTLTRCAVGLILILGMIAWQIRKR